MKGTCPANAGRSALAAQQRCGYGASIPPARCTLLGRRLGTSSAHRQPQSGTSTAPCAAPSSCRRPAAARAAAVSVDAETSTSGRPAEQQEWQAAVCDILQDSAQLIRLTLKGKISSDMPYRQVIIRPVMLKGVRHLQVVHYTQKQDITKNYTPAAALPYLQELLGLPWHSAAASTLQQDLRVQISKRGRVIMQRNSAGTNISSSGSGSGSGDALMSSARAAGPLQLSHDRAKVQPIDGSVPDAFLQQIGLQTADGRVKANMQAKFTQINEFLKLLIHTDELQHLLPAQAQQQQQPQQHAQQQGEADTSSSQPSPPTPPHSASATLPPSSSSTTNASSSSGPSSSQQAIHILDCGCGSSHLTFGTYHYLHHIKGWPVQLTGVDSNAALMERSNRTCQELGLGSTARFHVSSIADFTPEAAPHIVLALHACDTATDQSLALGVRQGAAIIAAAPCCHKNLHQQLTGWPLTSSSSSSSSQAGGQAADASAVVLAPMLKDGIMRQRFVDLLTDTFRALLLRICGYRTDVVEFVSAEHTARNLLIRAVKKRSSAQPTAAAAAAAASTTPQGRKQQQQWQQQQAKLVAEYVALKQMWGVTPHLEELLQDLLPPEATGV